MFVSTRGRGCKGGGGENSRRTRMRMRRRTKMPGVFVNVVGLVWFRLNCCCVLLPHHPKVSNEKSVQQGMERRMSQTKKKVLCWRHLALHRTASSSDACKQVCCFVQKQQSQFTNKKPPTTNRKPTATCVCVLFVCWLLAFCLHVMHA